MESSNHPIERKDFEALIHAIGFEIEHAQVKLIVAANAQMLFHYWKLGNFILYHQKRLGWGGKVISQISKAIKMLRNVLQALIPCSNVSTCLIILIFLLV